MTESGIRFPDSFKLFNRSKHESDSFSFHVRHKSLRSHPSPHEINRYTEVLDALAQSNVLSAVRTILPEWKDARVEAEMLGNGGGYALSVRFGGRRVPSPVTPKTHLERRDGSILHASRGVRVEKLPDGTLRYFYMAGGHTPEHEQLAISPGWQSYEIVEDDPRSKADILADAASLSTPYFEDRVTTARKIAFTNSNTINIYL